MTNKSVVEVSPVTGARVAGPFSVALVFDGINDYPFAFGSPTYHDSIFRSWAAGNITADPTRAGHLTVVWSDMRNGPATSSDPYGSTAGGSWNCAATAPDSRVKRFSPVTAFQGASGVPESSWTSAASSRTRSKRNRVGMP